MKDIPIHTDPAVPKGEVYVGRPEDFQLADRVGLVAMLHPDTVMDFALRREIEEARKRIGRVRGLGS